MTGLDLETIGYLTSFQDGVAAYVDGQSRDTCPWLPETDECLEWLRGWDEACQEDQPDE